ncbi:hypothetical protein GTW65_19295 [Streptomyces sp. SID4956]|nr:hypothetical protein [Streptomyces sp. SID4956]
MYVVRCSSTTGSPGGSWSCFTSAGSQISMDVYTHVVGDSEREAVGMLAELLEDPLIG